MPLCIRQIDNIKIYEPKIFFIKSTIINVITQCRINVLNIQLMEYKNLKMDKS